jgi:hypothetical protein
VPKRVRYFLDRDSALLAAVARIFFRTIARCLRRGAGRDGQAGAVMVTQHFGDALNRHTHLHAVVADGVFTREPCAAVAFHEASPTPEQRRRVEEEVRDKTLGLLVRRGCLEEEDAGAMREWGHSGFSLNAEVALDADDRKGLERLVRYCLRPPFALDRLALEDGEVVYRLSRPAPDGRREVRLAPLDFLRRLVALIARPRTHLTRYFGAFSSHASLRPLLATAAPGDASAPPPAQATASLFARNSTRRAFTWSKLIARVYEDDPLRCRRCGNEMRIVSFITQPSVIKGILAHIGAPTTPPPIRPARAPP